MRKSSKMLSLVIALIFLFSAVTPALALSADAPDAGARLKALGIIEGYPDGSLGLDRTITRAEMAVVLAEMSGMGSAATVLKSVPSKFSDVATNVWYTGYVNLAANQSWVSGYPDGSFKPNANVTYAEAVTMMLNVLGYGKGDLPGTWPLNYLVKAAELGITDDVTFSTGAPAVRGDVFVFASEALDEQTVAWSKDESDWTYGATLLSKLNLTPTSKITVNDAYLLVGSNLNNDDRAVGTVSGATYKVAAGFDIRPYVGVETEFYLNKDSKIVAVKSSETVYEEKVTSIVYDGSAKYSVKFDGNSTTYSTTAATVFTVNDVKMDASAFAAVYGAIDSAEGMIKYTRGSSSTIKAMDITHYNGMTGSMLVKEVRTDRDKVILKAQSTGTETTFDVDDQNMFYGVDGFSDIKAGDVVYWSASGTDRAIYVVRNIVTGSATSYSAGSWITVNGTRYNAGDTKLASTDGGKNYSILSTFKDFSGESATLTLDGYGKVYAITGTVSAGADNVAYAIGEIKYNETFGSGEYRIKLFLSNGTIATYYFDTSSNGVVKNNTTGLEVSPSASDAKWKGSLVGDQLVEFGLNSDGKINVFDTYSGDVSETLPGLVGDHTKVDRINNGTNRYAITSNTVFVNLKGSTPANNEDPVLVSWESVKAAGNITSTIRVYGEEISATSTVYEAKFVVFPDDFSGAAKDYAVFHEGYKIGSDNWAGYVSSAGKVDSASAADYSAWAKGDIVRIASVAAGEVSLVREVYSATPAVALAASAYNSQFSTLTVGGVTYDVDNSTLVVDASKSGAPEVTTLGALGTGDAVRIMLDGNLIKAVSIITRP